MAAGRDAPLERATGARSAPMPRVVTSAWRNSLVKSTAAPSASQVPPETSRVEELDALSEILGDFRAEGDELVIDTEKRVEKNKLREDIQAPTIFAHTHYASPSPFATTGPSRHRPSSATSSRNCLKPTRPGWNKSCIKPPSPYSSWESAPRCATRCPRARPPSIWRSKLPCGTGDSLLSPRICASRNAGCARCSAGEQRAREGVRSGDLESFGLDVKS